LLGHKGGVFRTDRPNPRVSLKSVMVMFGRTDRMKDLLWSDTPITDEDGDS
jgi:hypothetical protein